MAVDRLAALLAAAPGAQRAARRRVRLPRRASPMGSTAHALSVRRSGSVLSALHSGRVQTSRTARRHAARRIRQRPAGRKGLWLGRIGATARSSSSPIPTVKTEPGTSTAVVAADPARENIDDVGFINAVVNDISGHAGVDPTRVRHRYQQRRHDGLRLGMRRRHLRRDRSRLRHPARRLRYAAPDIGDAHPRHRRPVDPLRRRTRHGRRSASTVPPVPDLNAFWRNVDQCARTSDHHQRTGDDVAPPTAPTACNVVLMTVDGGGHELAVVCYAGALAVLRGALVLRLLCRLS